MATMTINEIQDESYEDVRIESVQQESEGWAITREDGWSFYVPFSYGVEPKIGDRARFYGEGLGRTVRGLALNGRVLYYRTEAEERAKFEREQADRDAERRRDFEAKCADHDRRIAALPEVFQRRLKKFWDANPDFRWQYEGYELMCCEQAVLFAETLETAEAVDAFHGTDWDNQKRMVPGLDEGHSGNSFDFSCRLARSYLTEPELVYLDHGALAILVGCEAYGCPHPAA